MVLLLLVLLVLTYSGSGVLSEASCSRACTQCTISSGSCTVPGSPRHRQGELCWPSWRRLQLQVDNWQHVLDAGQSLWSLCSSLTLLSINGPFTSLDMRPAQGGCAVNLTDLLIQHSRLRSISADAFSGTPALQTLRINMNRNLRAVVATAFSGLTRLTVLDLGHNALRTVEFGVTLSNVRVLRLGHNQLRWLRDGAFERLEGLRVLELANNRLSWLTPDLGLFRGLKWLQNLDLASNMLTGSMDLDLGGLGDQRWPGKMGWGVYNIRLPQLRSLDLSDNKLRWLRLKGCGSALRVVRAVNNTLDSVPLIEQCEGLRRVLVRGNHLQIHEGALRGQQCALFDIDFCSPELKSRVVAGESQVVGGNSVTPLTLLSLVLIGCLLMLALSLVGPCLLLRHSNCSQPKHQGNLLLSLLTWRHCLFRHRLHEPLISTVSDTVSHHPPPNDHPPTSHTSTPVHPFFPSRT